jgi:hypothetical protein
VHRVAMVASRHRSDASHRHASIYSNTSCRRTRRRRKDSRPTRTRAANTRRLACAVPARCSLQIHCRIPTPYTQRWQQLQATPPRPRSCSQSSARLPLRVRAPFATPLLSRPAPASRPCVCVCVSACMCSRVLLT